MHAWPRKQGLIGLYFWDWRGTLTGNSDIMFRVSKTAVSKKKGIFSRILSDFGVNVCANLPLGANFERKASLKPCFMVSFWHEKNPHLRCVLKKIVVMHAYSIQFYIWLAPSAVSPLRKFWVTPPPGYAPRQVNYNVTHFWWNVTIFWINKPT